MGQCTLHVHGSRCREVKGLLEVTVIELGQHFQPFSFLIPIVHQLGTLGCLQLGAGQARWLPGDLCGLVTYSWKDRLQLGRSGLVQSTQPILNPGLAWH